MSFQSLYTILGIAIAIWALMGRMGRSEVLIRLQRIDLILLACLLVFLNWQAFSGVIPGPKVLQFVPIWLGDEWVGYLATAVSFCIIFARQSWQSIDAWNHEKLVAHLEGLYQAEDYADLTFWLVKVLPTICHLQKHVNDDQTLGAAEQRLIDFFADAITSQPVAENLAKQSPAVALKIIGEKLPGSTDFQDLYIEEMVTRPFGQLAQECWRLQAGIGLDIGEKEENPIFNYYLADCNIANDTEIYRSLGDSIIKCIRQRRRYRPEQGEDIRTDHSRLHEYVRNPVPIGCTFFRLMLQRTCDQLVPWHMWVYYLKEWIKLLLKEVKAELEYDTNSEWPTIFHYEIWLILDALRYMLNPLKRLDEDAMNERAFESVDRQHENGVPLKGILFCISECWAAILASELDACEKDYFYETVMRTLEDTARIQDGNKSQDLLIELLANGPPFSANEETYKDQFQSLLNSTRNWRPNGVGFGICAKLKKELFS